MKGHIVTEETRQKISIAKLWTTKTKRAARKRQLFSSILLILLFHLSETLAAVYRTVLSGLEWDNSLSAASSTNCCIGLSLCSACCWRQNSFPCLRTGRGRHIYALPRGGAGGIPPWPCPDSPVPYCSCLCGSEEIRRPAGAQRIYDSPVGSGGPHSRQGDQPLHDARHALPKHFPALGDGTGCAHRTPVHRERCEKRELTKRVEMCIIPS